MTATPVLLSVNVLLAAAGDGAAIPAPGPAAGWPGSRELCVTVAPFGKDRRSVLELADACDVPTRWSCRTGVCHTCTTLLLSGDITYSPDPVEPPADGEVLTCCARPRDDIVLDM